jgi:hypothetical protein
MGYSRPNITDSIGFKVVGPDSNANAFKHFIWKRHAEPRAWDNALPEVLTTDGINVRRLRSHEHKITFQEFAEPMTSKTIQRRIEGCVSNGSALVGYSVFSDIDVLAIMGTGPGNHAGWIALPYSKNSEVSFPTMPIQLAEHPTLKLTGRATIVRRGRSFEMETALLQEGKSFCAPPNPFNIFDHVEKIEMRAQVRGAERKTVRFCRSATPKFFKRSNQKIEAIFEVDSTMLSMFGRDPGLSVWCIVDFDMGFLCLPEEWRRFWMAIDLDLSQFR